MKSTSLLLFATLVLIGCQSISRTTETGPESIGPDLEVRTLTPGVFIVNHLKPWPANSMVVELSPTELLMVDSPYTPAATTLVLDWMAKTFGNRKITAINTHWHVDRIAGNEVFLKRNIPVYGSDMTRQNLIEKRDHERASLVKNAEDPNFKAAFAKMRFSEPNKTFPLKDGLKLILGGKTVEVFYPGPGHTKDNVIVYLPNYKLLFGGCFIVGMPKLGNLAEADLRAWPESLTKLSRFEVDWVIPGHGSEFTPSLIGHTEKLVKDAVKN